MKKEKGASKKASRQADLYQVHLPVSVGLEHHPDGLTVESLPGSLEHGTHFRGVVCVVIVDLKPSCHTYKLEPPAHSFELAQKFAGSLCCALHEFQLRCAVASPLLLDCEQRDCNKNLKNRAFCSSINQSQWMGPAKMGRSAHLAQNNMRDSVLSTSTSL